MEIYSLVVGLSLTIGVGLLVHPLFSFVVETGRRLDHRARQGRLAVLGIPKSSKEESSIEEVSLGLGHIPWNSIYAISTLIGLILLAVLGPSLSSTKWLFLTFPLVTWGCKRYLIQQRKRFMLSQIRQFLIDLRLHMSLRGSLLLGLESIGQTSLESPMVYQSLKHRLSGGSARSGLDLLRQIAKDVQSPIFSRIIQRIQAAQQSGGVTDIDQTLTSAIDDLNEEISYQTEEQMQRLPTRITLLAMPFLLGPIVILLFYPLVDRILQTLSGVGIGGGF